MKKQIKCWLEAGIMEGDKLFPSTEGTPQGGIISPLLANITLHVLENKLKIFVASKSKAPTMRNLLKSRTNVINMIKELNLRIKGWTNYYRIGVVSKTFSSLDHWLFWRLFLWACKTHTTRGNKWIAARYFLNNPENIWKFGSKLQDKVYYQTFHRRTNVRRHIKVQNTRSPYDKDWVYWGYRLSNFQDGVIPNRVLKLLRIQKRKCPICHLNFLCNDNVHVDHIIPRSQGGSDVYQNLQLLHQHCHQNKTREDIKYLKY